MFLTQTLINFKHFKIGTEVNLEVDIIARYLERLILGNKAADATTSGISMEMLSENGFIK